MDGIDRGDGIVASESAPFYFLFIFLFFFFFGAMGADASQSGQFAKSPG